MALAVRLAPRVVLFSQNFAQINRNFGSFRNAKAAPKAYLRTLCIIGGGIAAVTCASLLKSNQVHAFNIKKMKPRSKKHDDERLVKLTARERRFIKFSSCEYNGQLYMTPQDFLDSVVEQEPRPRLKRKSLKDSDIEKVKEVTPSLKKGSVHMFRDLRDKGIISYTEYLFLLSILTKPQSGFRIAFNMFDTDGNQKVDKNEFLVIQKVIGYSLQTHAKDDETRKILLRLVSTPEQAKLLFVKKKERKKKAHFMEKIFSGAWRDKRGLSENDEEGDTEDEQDTYIDDEEGLQRRHKVDTTLQLHFFGRKGNQVLNYEGFYKFMDDLQTEVLQLEFSEFSKGNSSITELDFAKILLRYTYLDTDEYDMFLERLLDRVKDESGIHFNEFRDFCRFLNNLEDFAMAMRMYTLADRAISKDEFARAVKICTGYKLTAHLIDTVFAIFDEDGDGLLSYKEFIAIMKDRLHRGFKPMKRPRGWKKYKICVKRESFTAKKTQKLFV